MNATALPLLLALTTPSPSPAAPPSPSAAAPASPKMFVFAFRNSSDIDAPTLRLVERLVVEEAAALGFDVLGAQDVQGLLDAEATRQAAGCDANVECLADIAGSLGAELAVSGDVSRVGGRAVLALSIANQQRAAVLGRTTVDVAHIDELPAIARATARKLFAPHATKRAKAGARRASTTSASALPAVLWGGAGVVGVAGAVAVVVGALPFVDAQVRAADASAAAARYASTGSSTALRDLGDAREAHELARASWNDWGAAVAVAGGAAVVVGAGLALGAVLAGE